jgi:hypothetical protein
VDEPAVGLRYTQALRAPRVDQCVGQDRIQCAQPSQQHRQSTVVVSVPRRPPARHSAAAFHDDREIAVIGFNEVLGIQRTAIVIDQSHGARSHAWPAESRTIFSSIHL